MDRLEASVIIEKGEDEIPTRFKQSQEMERFRGQQKYAAAKSRVMLQAARVEQVKRGQEEKQ